MSRIIDDIGASAVRRINWRVLPFLMVLYLVAYIDRSNISIAASGIAAAVSIALINALANVVGIGLPPLIGWIKDATGNFDDALMVVASALLVGGVPGIFLAPHSRKILRAVHA